MTEEILKALDYGVLGLCAVMVIFSARVIYKEQSRESETKPGLIKLTYSFLGFCAFLVVANSYLQINQHKSQQKIELLKEKLWNIERALDDKGYTELSSLVASEDPIIRERMQRTVNRLREQILDAQQLLEE